MKGTIERIWELNNLQLTVDWKIKNFKTIQEEHIISPEIKTNLSDGSKWRLILYPKGYDEELNKYVRIWLEKNGQGYQLEANYSFAVNCKTIQNKAPERNHKFLLNDITRYGVRQFVPLTDLDDLLVDGSFTVQLKIKYLNGYFFKEGNNYCLHVQNMYNLLNNGNYSDFSINIDGKLITVHKSILSANCEYLDTESGTKVLDVNSAVKLLQVPHKYLVVELQADCEKLICENITNDNVIQALVVGHQLERNKLTEECINLIVENGKLNVHQYPEFELFENYAGKLSLYKAITDKLFKKINKP